MKEDSVRSVERAFAILKCFSLDDYHLNLTTITEQIGLPVTTTLRLLTTLVSLGLLKRNGDRSYSLGNEAYLIGAVARAHFKPQQIAHPYMSDLRDETKEAVSLYGLEGEFRVCYEHVPSLLTMRCVVRVGDHFPLWAGAGGKVMLAYEDEAVIEREAAKLKKITDGTLTDRKKFLEDLTEIRSRDYAISRGEREDGILSLAVPIFNREKRAPLCMSIAGPSTRFDDDKVAALIPHIQEMCTKIARQLYIA
ncbi:IclR family transcriptional regulator [Synergistaceae bacterium OttesenSCG-928-I11]|nr:IclR family transcriptional regulator [Synergistaceae bacterium OttesenSCG-928-I11]